MTDAALLSEKIHRFGVLGAGIIPDSLAALKVAEAQRHAREAAAELAARGAAEASADAGAAPPAALVASEGRRPAGPPTALAPPPRAPPPRSSNGELTREEVMWILEDTARVQGVVQREVSALARELAKERTGDGGKKKKKAPSLSFLSAHEKVQELGLPREPLEDYGLTESAFQRLLLQYEEDEEVMTCAQKLLHPVGKGDPERAKGITVGKIVEIHRFMVTEMQKTLDEFLRLDRETRRGFSGKECETTAELLVSLAVEQHLSVRCEDVEQAVIRFEEQLQGHADFTRCTEQLATMMQHLIGAAQPRVGKDEFLVLLREMGDSTKKAKVFAKKLYEDYRGKLCSIVDAYARFDAFTEETSKTVTADGVELPDLCSMDVQLLYQEYRDDEDVRAAWEKAGVESNMLMLSMMSGSPGAASSSLVPPAAEERKGKKLKSSEIIEMQELMVDELKRTVETATDALRKSNGHAPWKAEVAIQMVQALASAAVERRYGATAEEMTVAGFQHAQQLQKNERFARATEKQQEILMSIAKLCQQ